MNRPLTSVSTHLYSTSMASPIDFIGPTLTIWIPLALMYVPSLYQSIAVDTNMPVESLFGIFTAQVYFYLLEYQDDPRWLKLYTMLIWYVICAAVKWNNTLIVR